MVLRTVITGEQAMCYRQPVDDFSVVRKWSAKTQHESAAFGLYADCQPGSPVWKYALPQSAMGIRHRGQCGAMAAWEED